LPAAKLLFSYVLGKPTPMSAPDRLDLDEWQQLRASIPVPEDAEATAQGVPIDFCLKVARLNRDTQDAHLSRHFLEGLGQPEAGRAYEERILGPRVEAPPSPSGMERRPPSPNGRLAAAAAAEYPDDPPLPNGTTVGAVLEQLFAGITEEERDWFQGYLERQFDPRGPAPSPNGVHGKARAPGE
jgi:hypothetical protein